MRYLKWILTFALMLTLSLTVTVGLSSCGDGGADTDTAAGTEDDTPAATESNTAGDTADESADGSDTAPDTADGTAPDTHESAPADTTPAESATESESEGEIAPDEITVPDGPVGEVLTDRTAFTLATGDAVLGLEIQDGGLSITRFTTKETNQNRAATGSRFALPQYYYVGDEKTAFDWHYAGYMNLRGEEIHTQYGYAFLFTDPQVSVTYELQVTAHFDFNGPFEFTGYLKNETGAEMDVQPTDYFSATTAGEALPDVWYFSKESGLAEGYTAVTGQHFAGTGVYVKNLGDRSSISISNNTDQDHNQGGQIPMMYLDFGTWGQYYALEWTNGTITAKQGDAAGSCAVSVSLGDKKWSRNFRTTIPAGDALYLPTVYMGIYDGDVDEGSNGFKRWFLHNKAPDILLEDANEPLVQQDMQIGLSAADYGIEAIKWDYGWWSNTSVSTVSGTWKTNEGLLEVNDQNYLNVLSGYKADTLAEFVEQVRASGMTLTAYVLTKDTELDREGVPTSVGVNAHPEWFSDRCVTGVGNSADFGNEECVAFYQQYLLNFFRETGVTTWRSDFEPICRDSDKANRHDANGKDVQYWCSVGFYEVVDYLYENLDYFRYESCCSGGAMKDFSTMRRAVIINCDDSADFLSLKMSFYDSSYCIHPAQLQLPVNAGSYTKGSSRYVAGDHDFGMRSQLVGAVMLCNWEGTKEADKASWEKYIGTYKSRIRPLIKYGDLYHVLPRPDGVNWDGFFYVDADAESETKGVLMIFKPTAKAGDSTTVKLRGLDRDTVYTVEYQDHTDCNTTATGAELMDNGLTVTFTEACTSDWVFLVAAD